MLVGESHSHAILAEFGRLHPQLAQDFEYGRVGVTIAFKFDDSEIVESTNLASVEIVKAQSDVDGKPFGELFVDQCDAVETIFQTLRQ